MKNKAGKLKILSYMSRSLFAAVVRESYSVLICTLKPFHMHSTHVYRFSFATASWSTDLVANVLIIMGDWDTGKCDCVSLLSLQCFRYGSEKVLKNQDASLAGELSIAQHPQKGCLTPCFIPWSPNVLAGHPL